MQETDQTIKQGWTRSHCYHHTLWTISKYVKSICIENVAVHRLINNGLESMNHCLVTWKSLFIHSSYRLMSRNVYFPFLLKSEGYIQLFDAFLDENKEMFVGGARLPTSTQEHCTYTTDVRTRGDCHYQRPCPIFIASVSSYMKNK